MVADTESIESKNVVVIGLGVAEDAQLSPQAAKAFQQSHLVIGSQRQLKVVANLITESQTINELPSLQNLADLIESSSAAQICLLASGDPLFFGIGKWASKHLSQYSIHYFPAVSSIQMACHKIGVSLQDATVVSLHGRPLTSIRRHLKSNHTLILLTDKNSGPKEIAGEALAAGFNESRLWVCEDLGYQEEKTTEFNVDDLIHSEQAFSKLHVTILLVRGEGGVYPDFPGILDQSFKTNGEPGKGLITKREVRINILSLMQVCAEDVVWDIGAGCGGVAVELAFWHPRAKIVAIEQHSERLEYLEHNRKFFGVEENLSIVAGRAPEVFSDLPKPNKVFIGGSDGEMAKMLRRVWARLSPAGVIVISAVTEQNKLSIIDFAQVKPCVMETLQIAVSKGATLAGQLHYKPNLPVTLFQLKKLKEQD